LENYINECIEKFDTHINGLANPFFSSRVIYDEKKVLKIVDTVAKKYENSLYNAVDTPFGWKKGLFEEFGIWRTIYMHFHAIIKQKGFCTENEYRFLIETNVNNVKGNRCNGENKYPSN
jgi:hypothetical protein